MPGIVAAGICLGAALVGLGRPDVWQDEAGTWAIASHGLGDLWRAVTTADVNGALYSAVMHLWLKAGDTPAWLRLPSVLATTAATFTFWLLARRLVSARWVALTGTLLFALNPFVLRYAQEARQYALATALVTAAALSLDRAVTGARGAWVGFTVFGSLAITAQAHAGLVLVCLLGSLVVAPRSRLRARPVLAAAGVTGVVGAGVATAMVLGDQGELDWRDHLAWIGDIGPGDVLDYGRELFGRPPAAVLAVVFVVVGACCLAGALPRTGTPRAPETDQAMDRWRWVMTASWGAGTLVLAMVLSMTVQPLFVNRYLLVAAPGVLLCATLGLDRLRPPAVRLAVVGVVVVVGASTFPDSVYDPDRTEPWVAATAELAGAIGPGDVLVVLPADASYGLAYHRHQQNWDLPEPVWPDRSWDEPWVYGPVPPPAGLDGTLAAAGRVWVFLREEAWGSDEAAAALERGPLAGRPAVTVFARDRLRVTRYDR